MSTNDGENTEGTGRTRRRIPVDGLAACCDSSVFKFESTETVAPLERGIVGQERAVRAMDFGLRTKYPGYNLFLTGHVGTGKTTYAQAHVSRIAVTEPTPDDWCYTYNFQQPDQPICLCLPPGQGRRLRSDMEELVDDLRREIRQAFDSEEWSRRRREVINRHEKLISLQWREADQLAHSRGFSVKRTPAGIFTIPLDPDGNPINQEQFNQMEEKERKSLTERGQELQNDISETLHRVRQLERELRQALKELERETGLYAVGHLINNLQERYAHVPKVREYLDQVKQDVVAHLDRFRSDGEEEGPSPFALITRTGGETWLNRYRINLLVDNSDTKGAPVVVETNPTYYNLFGKVEYRGDFGTLVTDFTMIKPGSVHAANGGYLIVQAAELLNNQASWGALKRALKTGEARIENLMEQLGLIATSGLKPEPVPLNVTVLLIGNPWLYHLLYTYDEAFRKFFKVRVDFDVEMSRTDEHTQLYASFVSSFCRREGLRHLDRNAMARVVEFSSRLAEHQGKLSIRFHEVTELIFEASSWAAEEDSPLVRADHLNRALEEKIFRSNRIEQKLLELIADGTLMFTVDGAVTGQVNGLTVLDVGDYRFGRPSRITARVSIGEKGVVAIERETEMSGPIHSKGVFILGAYLAGMYAHDKPLSLSASLCFEQLYEEVEGDSASSAELYALLSELSGLPLDQGIAITGSINQRGEIQSIGGVNEKIEGFFHTCKVLGLTGRQGVLIPHQNQRNLMLKEEVREAVTEGRFHIYAVRSVGEGIELLTGRPAGEPEPDGTYPEGTVNRLVDDRLREMADIMRHYGRDGPEGNDE